MADIAAQEPAGSPRAVFAYIGIVCLLAIATVLASWAVVGPPHDLVALAILCVMGIIGNILREPDVGSRVGFSFLSTILLACVVIVGPVGGALVGALSTGLQMGSPPTKVRFFNAGMTAFWAASGGMVYIAVGGARDLTRLDGPTELLLYVAAPLIVADVAQMLANAALLAGIVRIDRGVPYRRFFVQMVTNLGLAYLGYGVIGFLFVILWIPADVGPFSAVLVLAPLFVAHFLITDGTGAA